MQHIIPVEQNRKSLAELLYLNKYTLVTMATYFTLLFNYEVYSYAI